MKLKIGDKVKIVKYICGRDGYFVGKVGTIVWMDADLEEYKLDIGGNWMFLESQLEFVSNTNSELPEPFWVPQCEHHVHYGFQSKFLGLHNHDVVGNFINNQKGGLMSSYKKVTNFIKGMKDPLKTMYQLGWVIIENDNYEASDEGLFEFEDFNFKREVGLVEEKTFAEYAAKKLKELIDNEKENKTKKLVF